MNQWMALTAAAFFTVPAVAGDSLTDDLHIGGAARFQYSYEEYDADNKSRGGDFDLDTFRINVDGSIHDVLLSAEWRYYSYMQVIHHAWVGYNMTPEWQVQAGQLLVPFGNQPYNSHNFFFSSNYYLGLEDDYDLGLKALWHRGAWDVQLAFLKNDELGGADGYTDDVTERYSYDVVGVRAGNEGLYDAPASTIGEVNTAVARLAYRWTATEDTHADFGMSLLRGGLNDGSRSAGHYDAAALHLNADWQRWNLQVQALRYRYDVDDAESGLMAVGAYAFYDTIAAEATSYTANLAYTQPVSWGPITALTFYSDNSWVTAKSAGLDDTWLNVLGVSIAAGPVFTYVDVVTAKNQPFIGGSMAGNDGERHQRININIGYYF